jgi:TusA-related sulfurtransferase
MFRRAELLGGLCPVPALDERARMEKTSSGDISVIALNPAGETWTHLISD